MRISKFQFQNQRKIRSQINSSQIIGPEFREMGLGHYYVSYMSWSGLKENCKERWQRAQQALAIAAERRSCFSNSAFMEQRYGEMDGSEEHI